MKLEGQIRIPSGCAISAVISREGKTMSGEDIIRSMIPMHDRSNGLGGGFAGYGIYPEYKEFYALHIFYNDNAARVACEQLLKDRFEIVKAENIPIRENTGDHRCAVDLAVFCCAAFLRALPPAAG